MRDPANEGSPASDLYFSILGSLRVDGPDGEIVVTSGKQRTLLAALIVDAGSVVSTDRLTDVMWGDEPTPTASKSLQTYVARLRRTLGFASGTAGVITTRPPGYLLDVESDRIDARRFEEQCRESRRLLDTDPATALQMLDEALALWRGDALAEFRDYPFAVADSERLNELRIAAEEDRFTAELAVGHHNDVIARLEVFTAQNPYRERPHEQLMLALYRSGRHPDALATFTRFRTRLAEELGLEPSDALRALETAVLHQSPDLDLVALPAPSRGLTTATIGPSRDARLTSPATVPVVGDSGLPAAVVAATRRGNFAGRAEELAVIERRLAQISRDERAGLVLIVGESGIGKTRLAAEALARCGERAPTIAFGRCDEEGLVPYQPFAETIESLLRQTSEVHRSDLAPILAPAATEAPDTTGNAPIDPREARRRLLFAMESVLASVPHPAIIVIDDLHWADRPTLQVLRHLLRAPRGIPILFVGTARAESLAPGSDIAGLLNAVDPADVTEIGLSGLTAAQAEDIAATDFPDVAELAGNAWERTSGNPFLLRELLRHLVETGANSLDTIPPLLREVVARRIAQLEPRLIDVLTAGALLGHTFRFGVAARAVDAEPAAVFDVVESAVLAGIIEPLTDADEYRFAHVLVRDSLAQRLGASRRLHLHLRLAEELGRVAPDTNLAAVAYHRHAALPEGDPLEAVSSARAAAAWATGRQAHEQAADMHGNAIDALVALGVPESERAQERLARAEAELRSGDLDAARAELTTVVMSARRHGDVGLLARAAVLMGDTGPQWGVDDELVAVLEEVLGCLPEDQTALRARITARLAQALYYSADVDRRRALTVRAEAEARRSGDSEALAWVLSASHDAQWGPDDVEGRVEAARKITVLGDALGHDELQLRGHGLLVPDLLECGRFDEAREATRRHAALAVHLNQPLHLRDVELWKAAWAHVEGRFDDERAAIIATRELNRVAQDPSGDLIYWIQRFGYVTARRIAPELDELADAYERIAFELSHVPAWRSALAYIHVLREDRAAVEAIVADQTADHLVAIPRDVAWLNAVTYLTKACAYLGDAELATLLRNALSPYANRIAVVDRGALCKGSVSHWLGLVERASGDLEAAHRSLTHARDLHRRLGATFLADESERELHDIPV